MVLLKITGATFAYNYVVPQYIVNPQLLHTTDVEEKTATSSYCACSKSVDIMHTVTASSECDPKVSAQEEKSSFDDYTMIVVSAVSLLVIVTLITVTLTQCLLILRMRRSKDEPSPYIEPSVNRVDVPTEPNEIYALLKMPSPQVREDVTFATEVK